MAARAVPRADIRPNSSFARVPTSPRGKAKASAVHTTYDASSPPTSTATALVGEPFDSRALKTR